MLQQDRIIFIHGLYGTSQGKKAIHLKGLFPDMLIPDFPGTLDERMEKLERVTAVGPGWTMIGSSYGGLMAGLYARLHPERVRKLVLLAPALIMPEFADGPETPIDIPTLIYIGKQDDLIPIDDLRPVAEAAFPDLTFKIVDDVHGLYETAFELDWPEILA
jgi:pimeloyl-ACP methyl ester carboxylesterase